MAHTDRPVLAAPTLEEKADGITVTVQWLPQDGLDRLDCHAWGLRPTPAHRRLARRLMAAIEAGAIVTPTEPYTDVNGLRGWHSATTILARTMNADLRHLGF